MSVKNVVKERGKMKITRGIAENCVSYLQESCCGVVWKGKDFAMEGRILDAKCGCRAQYCWWAFRGILLCAFCGSAGCSKVESCICSINLPNLPNLLVSP